MDKGLWLKGCLHCHSKNSDGFLDPEAVASFYESRGYRLLALTDHEKISGVKGFNGVFQFGVEASRGKCMFGASYHIVALGVDDAKILDVKDPQLFIDRVNEEGGLTFIAHPYWSNLTHEDLTQLEGYVGIEVYNTGCDVEVAKGYSTVHWDCLLSSGRKIWGIAVDDSHRYVIHPLDADGGWIWLNMDDPSPEAALKSIREGKFYSSMAPKITMFIHTLSYLKIECTPIHRIDIISSNGRGHSILLETIMELLKDWSNPNKRRLCERILTSLEHSDEGLKQKIYLETVKGSRLTLEINKNGIIGLEAKMNFNYPYVRVELADENGRRAWLNPTFNL